MAKIWVISEAYYPDEDGTAHYMTRLAEHFAGFWPVHVLCGRPKYSGRGRTAPKTEIRNGVRIRRVPDPALDKDVLVFRIINVLVLSGAILLRMVRSLRPGDVALAVTSPPALPVLALVACRIRGAKLAIRVDDVYPEALIASGVLAGSHPFAKMLAGLNGWLFRRADRIVVLGRDMERLVRSRIGTGGDRVRLIRNWADLETVAPSEAAARPLLRELGLEGKDVVQCAGNMGRVQAIETMFGAAELLRNDERIRFLFIGNGAKRPWMEREKAAKGLTNVTLLDFRARSEQSVFLNACGVSMASLIGGMSGAGVPSRMYNVMAAGKPLIAVADHDSEMALVVAEEGIGWIVPPASATALAASILQAFADRTRLADMGRAARRVAEQKYSSAAVLAEYRSLMADLSGSSLPSPPGPC